MSKVHTGTLDIESLLAVRFQSAAEFGLNTIQEVLERDLAAHNMLVQEMMGDLCEFSTDRQRIYGTSVDENEMDKMDEYGRPRTERALPGSTVGFPLHKFGKAIGWTSTWFKTHTPADLAATVLGVQKGHLKSIKNEIKRALFHSTNYTANDHLVDKINLDVKRLLNADGAPIPEGPDQQVFDPVTHTHYNASAILNDPTLLALIDDVIEHGHGGEIKLVISKGNEAQIRALPSFQPYSDPRLSLGIAFDRPLTRLDLSRLDNRAIGLFGAAEVWVKSWAIPGYAFVYDASDGGKPLVFRQREQTTLQGLMIASEFDTYPLHAEYMEAEFGIGVWTRTNGAILNFTSGVYVDPMI